MSITMQAFQAMLQKNVIEARFIRRHDKPEWSGVRGAIITTNWRLLNDQYGIKALHFKPPNGRGMGYDHRKYNLVVGWDLLRQEYRVFGVENSVIIRMYDVSDDEGYANFWDFMKRRVMQLTTREKLIYMGYIGNQP